ncbi:hypothetical protein GCM10028827_09210 [Mucilaginibacter myungsuensis]
MLMSCKDKEEKLKDQMMPLLTDIIKQDSLVSKIDSLRIFKIDTLTELDIQERMMHRVRANIDHFQKLSDNSLEIAKLKMSQAQSSISSMKLSQAIDAYDLADIERDNAEKYAEESKDEAQQAKAYSDSSQKYIKLLEDHAALRRAHRIDSVKFKGYIARFKLLGADKDNAAVKLDSMYVFFNENLRVIKGF